MVGLRRWCNMTANFATKCLHQISLWVSILKRTIIVDHLSDYFELENQTLRDTNDQFIEACHAKVRKFFENHPNYNFKDKSGERYGKALLAAIIHFNSNNLGSVN